LALFTFEQVEERISGLLTAWTVYELTTAVIGRAVSAARRHQMNYWDAQIWAVARLNGLATILSEDFADGSAVEGVRFVNPFAAGFELGRWLA